MIVQFESLEQQPGTHVVPIRMTREQLEEVAQTMSDLTTRIEAQEDDLRQYSKDKREEIKDLEDERSAKNRTFRYQREPKKVEGLWGFDLEDHGTVKCRTCVERRAKIDDQEAPEVKTFDTEKEFINHHKHKLNQFGDPHPPMGSWERPLGTKWFVLPESGDVFGPLAIQEPDLQKPLAPVTEKVDQFQLAFDIDSVVPLLDDREHGEAKRKIQEQERAATAEELLAESELHDLCAQCSLPNDMHPDDADDPCLAATNAAKDKAKGVEPKPKKKASKKPKK